MASSILWKNQIGKINYWTPAGILTSFFGLKTFKKELDFYWYSQIDYGIFCILKKKKKETEPLLLIQGDII